MTLAVPRIDRSSMFGHRAAIVEQAGDEQNFTIGEAQQDARTLVLRKNEQTVSRLFRIQRQRLPRFDRGQLGWIDLASGLGQSRPAFPMRTWRIAATS